MHAPRAALLGIALMAAAAPLPAQTATSPRAQRVAGDVRYLASDALAGRKTGEAGNDSAAQFIARQLRALGLRPAGDSGTFFQRWTAGSSAATRQAGIEGKAARNVVAVLPGAGRLAGQAVVLGAHFDHLGMGGMGSLNPDSVLVHNGADDNASGTAALLEAGRVMSAGRRPGPRDMRSVVFVFFSGEEQGTLGSTWYTNHPAAPMDSTIAMVNFDMVGRLREGKLLALGARSATEWQALIDSVNQAARLDVRASGDGWGPSDHAPFFAQHRPVLHLFTDLHEDYHRPSDDAPAINADGIVQVADFAVQLAQRLRARSSGLTFVDAPPPAPPVAASGARPSLGTIPDMTDEPGGVRLSGVRAGSPAEAGGLRQGDILTGMGTHTIADLQDFQNALMAHRPGQQVEIRFKRGEQNMSVMVTLGGAAPRN